MNIWAILATCGILSMLAFVIRQGLLAFCFGEITVVGTTIVLCSSIGASFEEALIASTLVTVIWSLVFLFIYEMFE